MTRGRVPVRPARFLPVDDDSAPRFYVEGAGPAAPACVCDAPADYLCWVVDGDKERDGSEFGICHRCAYLRWAALSTLR